MAENKEKRTAYIVSESGSTMMAIADLGREGNRLVIHGRMIGAWPCKMYVNFEDVLKLGRLLFAPQVIFYVLSVPFLYLFRLQHGKQR